MVPLMKTTCGSPLVALNQIVAVSLPQPDLTGAAKMAVAFAREFVRRGYAVVLLHGAVRSGHESILDQFRSVGASLVCNPAFGPAVSPSVFRWIVRELTRIKPVAAVSMFVTTDAKYVGPACRLLGYRHVASVQNDLVFYGNPIARRLKSALFRAIYRQTVDLAVCTSDRTRIALLQEHGMAEARLALLPNGVDTRRVPKLRLLERSALRKEFGVAEHEVMLINVGRLHPQKGQDVLIEAIAQLSNQHKARIKLVLVGDADVGKCEVPEFAATIYHQLAINGLDSKVHFAGWRNDIPAVLQAADIFVHSAKWEGPPFPLAVLEAMACGLPVVMTDCAGRPEEFVDGHHGYCVEAGQADQLSEAISSLLAKKPNQLRGIGRNCRALVEEKYEISTIGKRFVDLVLDITTRPAKSI